MILVPGLQKMALMKADPFGQQGCRTFEALARQAPHLDPTQFLVLGTGERSGADLARFRQCLARQPRHRLGLA